MKRLNRHSARSWKRPPSFTQAVISAQSWGPKGRFVLNRRARTHPTTQVRGFRWPVLGVPVAFVEAGESAEEARGDSRVCARFCPPASPSRLPLSRPFALSFSHPRLPRRVSYLPAIIPVPKSFPPRYCIRLLDWGYSPVILLTPEDRRANCVTRESARQFPSTIDVPMHSICNRCHKATQSFWRSSTRASRSGS